MPCSESSTQVQQKNELGSSLDRDKSPHHSASRQEKDPCGPWRTDELFLKHLQKKNMFFFWEVVVF